MLQLWKPFRNIVEILCGQRAKNVFFPVRTMEKMCSFTWNFNSKTITNKWEYFHWNVKCLCIFITEAWRNRDFLIVLMLNQHSDHTTHQFILHTLSLLHHIKADRRAPFERWLSNLSLHVYVYVVQQFCAFFAYFRCYFSIDCCRL